MSTNHLWLGQFALSGAENDFTLDKGAGANAVTLTADDYFLFGYTGENAGTYQLLDHIEERCWNIGYVNTHCSFDVSTGKVTINFAGHGSEDVVNIVWTDPALQTLLGFSGSQVGATGYVAENCPKHIWWPKKPPVGYPGDAEKLWSPRSTTKVGRSIDGTSYTVPGNILYDTIVRYMYLPEADILEPASGSVNADLQSFFEDVIHEGKPVRLIHDRTSYVNSSCYITGLVGQEDDDEIGGFADFRERHVDTYNGLWTVEFPLLKYVT